MTYIMNFLALFLFAETLTAKHRYLGQKPRLKQLNYRSSSGEIAETIFHYDQHGLMDTANWATTDGSMTSTNRYCYNSKDRLISAYRVFSNGQTSYEIYLYDEKGYKVHESFLRSDGLKGSADFIYDLRGRCEKVICDHYKGWITGEILYDQQSDPATKAQILRDDRSIGRIDFKYNRHGLLLRDTWTFDDGFTQTFEYLYEQPV